MKLMPREEKFYEFFLEQVGIITEASESLLRAAQSGNGSLAEAANKIRRLEEEGDKVVHQIFVKLNQTFITPLDPEDLHSLSSHLENVLDGIEDSVHRMVAYRLDPIPSTVVELCRTLRECAGALQLAFAALAANKPVLDHCIEINRLGNSADELIRDAMSEMFLHEKDAIVVIKTKEIYDFLARTAGACQDVADALQNVIVKNS